jgi:hypothetical protein
MSIGIFVCMYVSLLAYPSVKYGFLSTMSVIEYAGLFKCDHIYHKADTYTGLINILNRYAYSINRHTRQIDMLERQVNSPDRHIQPAEIL